MRVLLTGATGFAGHHLVRHLREHGDEVHVTLVPGWDETAPPGAEGHEIPITEPDAVADLTRRLAPTAVGHLAGASSVGRSFDDPHTAWSANLLTTLGVMEGLRRSGACPRAFSVSSGEVWGRVPLDELPVSEDTPVSPTSPYAAAKAAAELAVLQYRDVYGLPVTVVRPFNHIGPGQDARFVVPSVARQIALGEAAGGDEIVVQLGNIDTRRDFTDVRDVVRAYRLILAAPEPPRHPVYLLGSGRSVSIRELVDGLAALARVPVRVVSDPTRRRDGEQPDLYGSAARLAGELGWEARIPLDTTLADTLDWWRGQVAPPGGT